MMRSMYSGVSSLRAHQVRMDVIGNNIANVNTVGYKASKVTFSETFSQTMAGAGSSSETGRGGTNPQQVGLGTNVGAVNVYHTQGATQRTDNTTDLMIDGNGYFIISPAASPGSAAQNRFYTRAGNFSVDRLGFLVDPAGYKVLDKDMKPIQMNKSETQNATATSEVDLEGNLDFDLAPDATTNISYTTTVDVYDSVGNTTTVTVNFGEKVTTDPTDAGQYTYRSVNLNVGTDNLGTVTPQADGTTGGTTASDPLYAEFDSKGNFTRLVNALPIGADGYADVDPTNATPVPPVAAFSFNVQKPGADPITIPVDNTMFDKFTHYAQETDVKGVAVNGNSAGALDSFTISSKGEVIGIFTNGERKTISTLGLADFDNPAGLLKVGGNRFSDTPNSGTPKLGSPSAGSFGSLTPGALEMSNVDLAAEFTDMITTQRGFQANSRVITTSDEILQELVSLKR